MAAAPPAAPAAPSPAELLGALSEQLGHPGAEKLYVAARKKIGPRVTRAMVTDLVKSRGAKQIFKPLKPSTGQSAAETPESRFQLDLIDEHNNPSNGFRYIVVLISVFTRQVWALPARSKEPETVAPVVRELLQKVGTPVHFVSTDFGNEFTGAVNDVLETAGTIHKLKSSPSDVNALAVIDRAIQTIRKRLSESLTDKHGAWSDRLQAVIKQYNESPHESLHQESPEDAEENPTVKHLLLEENSQKAAGNQELLKSRKARLDASGTFRRPRAGAAKNAFRRSFKPTWGPVEKVESLEGSVVKPQGEGAPIDIKHVQIVEPSTDQARPAETVSLALEAKKEKMSDWATEAYEWLGADEKSIMTLATHLRTDMSLADYQANLATVGINARQTGALDQVLRMFPEYFTMTRGGYYLKRAA